MGVRHGFDPVCQRAFHHTEPAAVPVQGTARLPEDAFLALYDDQCRRADRRSGGRRLFPLCQETVHGRRVFVPRTQRQHAFGAGRGVRREPVDRAVRRGIDRRAGVGLPEDPFRPVAHTERPELFSGPPARPRAGRRAGAGRHPGRFQPADATHHAEQRHALHLVEPQGEPHSEQSVLRAADIRQQEDRLHRIFRARRTRSDLFAQPLSPAGVRGRLAGIGRAQRRDFHSGKFQQRTFGAAQSGSVPRRAGIHAFSRFADERGVSFRECLFQRAQVDRRVAVDPFVHPVLPHAVRIDASGAFEDGVAAVSARRGRVSHDVLQRFEPGLDGIRRLRFARRRAGLLQPRGL